MMQMGRKDSVSDHALSINGRPHTMVSHYQILQLFFSTALISLSPRFSSVR